jgi:hypothetical protein
MAPRDTPDSVKLAAALQALREMNIPFRGPFVTPRGNRIFLVGVADCILTEAEIVSFYEAHNLTAERTPDLLRELQQSQRTPPQGLDSHRPSDRRRSQRVALQLAVIIEIEVHTGQFVHTDGFTVSVNAHGGSLESSLRVPMGHKLTLINPHTGKAVACNVVRVQSSDRYSTLAFEFAEPSPDFWPLSSPPPDWTASRHV